MAPQGNSSAKSGAGPQNLTFHPDFNKAEPGSVILQAGDDKAESFYFSLALLSAVSPFFAALPPASSADRHNGTPIIPLHDTTSKGLFLFLLAVRSTISSDPFVNPLEATELTAGSGILDAAVIGKKFDCPVIFRILVESLDRGGDHILRDPQHPYIAFAIWAIGGVRSQLEQAALATVQPNAGCICDLDPDIINACKSHSEYWYPLLEYHLRYLHAASQLHRFIGLHAQHFQQPFTAHHQPHNLPCSETLKTVPESWRICQILLEARAPWQILAVRRDKYGLRCGTCQMEAEGRFGPSIDSLETRCRFFQ